MKSFLVASLFAGAALAQSLNGLPDCAKSCVNLNNLGGCKTYDIKCICSSKQFIDAISCCVSKACPNKSDQDATIKYAQGICTPQGVTNLPTAATCAAGAASTGAGTGSTTSAATNGTTTASGSTTTPTLAGNSTSNSTTGSNSTAAITSPATSATGGSSSGGSSSSSGGAAATLMAHGAAVAGGIVMAAFL